MIETHPQSPGRKGKSTGLGRQDRRQGQELHTWKTRWKVLQAFALPDTYEEVGSAVLLQECMKVIPEFRHPVQNLDEILIGQVSLILRLHHLPVQVAHQEAIGWLHVVGEGHHSKKVIDKDTESIWSQPPLFYLNLTTC